VGLAHPGIALDQDSLHVGGHHLSGLHEGSNRLELSFKPAQKVPYGVDRVGSERRPTLGRRPPIIHVPIKRAELFDRVLGLVSHSVDGDLLPHPWKRRGQNVIETVKSVLESRSVEIERIVGLERAQGRGEPIHGLPYFRAKTGKIPRESGRPAQAIEDAAKREVHVRFWSVAPAEIGSRLFEFSPEPVRCQRPGTEPVQRPPGVLGVVSPKALTQLRKPPVDKLDVHLLRTCPPHPFRTVGVPLITLRHLPFPAAIR
jgi:hypothetical protein